MVLSISLTTEGDAISPMIFIEPVGKARRLARAGEVMVSIWADVSGLVDWIPGIDYRRWTGELPTFEGGRVHWAPFDYGRKWYRLTARHVESGVTVGKEFRTRAGAVVEEKAQTVLDRGTAMPPTFEQPMMREAFMGQPMGLDPYSHIPSMRWTPAGYRME